MLDWVLNVPLYSEKNSQKNIRFTSTSVFKKASNTGVFL